MSGNYARGDKCWSSHKSHSWSRGDGFAMLAKLEGDKKVFFLCHWIWVLTTQHSNFHTLTNIYMLSSITGGSRSCPSFRTDKLYSGSSDGTARIWDCNTGQCAHLTRLGDEVGTLISEGPWVFIGVKNVKALNIHTANEFSIKGTLGQVHAMVVSSDLLFAGAQKGVTNSLDCCIMVLLFHGDAVVRPVLFKKLHSWKFILVLSYV
ncbi:hypothetical protein DITRI_Ditri16bG0101400 [Diplodiscus trichospermus]